MRKKCFSIFSLQMHKNIYQYLLTYTMYWYLPTTMLYILLPDNVIMYRIHRVIFDIHRGFRIKRLCFRKYLTVL